MRIKPADEAWASARLEELQRRGSVTVRAPWPRLLLIALVGPLLLVAAVAAAREEPVMAALSALCGLGLTPFGVSQLLRRPALHLDRTGLRLDYPAYHPHAAWAEVAWVKVQKHGWAKTVEIVLTPEGAARLQQRSGRWAAYAWTGPCCAPRPCG